jgi:hypothetical protein
MSAVGTIGGGFNVPIGKDGQVQTETHGAGLQKGVNLGKQLLKKKEHLKGRVQRNHVHPGDGSFPVEVAPYNESEANLREKVDILKQFAGDIDLPKNFQIPFNIDTQELISIQDEKRGTIERLNFYEWLYKLMDKYDWSPDIVKFVKEHYPEYFEEQIALIEKNLELQKRAAMLAVKVVPDTREDIEFLWGIQTGQIQLPTHVAYDKGSKNADGANFKRGLLSIKGTELGGKIASDDTFKIMGGQATPYVNFAAVNTAGKATVPAGYNWWK